MNNIIERIQTIIVAGIIFTTIYGIAHGCVCFLNNQNFDELLSENNVYDFTDESYLAKDNIVLCGVEFKPGDVIQKDYYNKCKN